MTYFRKTTMVAVMLGLAACAGPQRFDNPVSTGSGSMTGSVDDPTSGTYFSQRIGDRVLFAVDQSSLSPEAQRILDGQASWLLGNPGYLAIIEGHADEQGTREYNLALGARRANAVMEYLLARGVPGSRLKFVSYGKERPVEICSEESCYTRNRRAVTVLSAASFGMG